MKFNCAYTDLVELNKLVPNPKNPNKHPDNQIERLAKIIDFQGQRSPIVISKRSGFIVKGHGRLLAIQKLGWKKAAVDFQEYESDAQEYADIVADNAIAQWAEMDLSQINTDFLQFGPELDVDLLGISSFKIDLAYSDFGSFGDQVKEQADEFSFTLALPVELKEKVTASYKTSLTSRIIEEFRNVD